MKQKIYKLKSNTLSRFLIGIACRNQNDSIAGLFVNTDPYDSIMCRETEFQAKKIELLINHGYENEILKIANIYQQKQNLSIIESSKTDSYWGVKAEYVSKIGKGANELGAVHTIIGKELKEAAKDISKGKFMYNGIELDLELVEKKQKEIEKARSDEKLNIMNITMINSIPLNFSQ